MNQRLLVTDDLIDITVTFWAENPRWFREIPYQHQCLSMSGIINYIIGTHFFIGTLTGAMYNDFLQNTLSQLIEDVDLAIR